MARFEEFLLTLRPILEGDSTRRTSLATEHYVAVEVPSTPGTTQSPLPLTVAAGGPKGLRLVATHGHNWVTIGPTSRGPRTPDTILEAVRTQSSLLTQACREGGRDLASLGKVILWTPAEPAITSIDQFDELAAPYVELGFDQFVLHHPAQTGPYGGDVAIFERIAARNGDASA